MKRHFKYWSANSALTRLRIAPGEGIAVASVVDSRVLTISAEVTTTATTRVFVPAATA